MKLLATLVVLIGLTTSALAQTVIDGKDLALKSSGEADGAGWKMSENGYVGTYVQLPTSGELHVTISATASSATPPPHLNIVVADSKVGGDLTAGANTIDQKIALPAGTYLVRIEYPNATADRPITFGKVSFDGAAVKNESSDANALAAADDYIANFRRGKMTIKLNGVAPGTAVHARLTKHAFIFGAAVGGFGTNELFVDHPVAGSDAAHYQDVLLHNFNLIVPGNAGKWAYNEDKKDVVTMDYIDDLHNFAAAHGLKLRMHTLLWNTGQQPKWVLDLVSAAAGGDASAKAELRKQIGERIQYFVRDRAKNYYAIDILNEPYHQQKYWDIFGPKEIAGIYRECAAAVKAAGASAHLCVNEYNILQWSQQFPFSGPYHSDPYANWYREYVETIRADGGEVDGIGVQYYTDLRPAQSSAHSPARMAATIQNLAVTGLPITLTEFGVQTKGDLSKAPQTESDTLRLVFGSNATDGFIQWGFWQKEMWEMATGGAFFKNDWTPTPVYQAWKDLMTKWTTDETAVVSSDGSIQLTGFYGDYTLTAGDKTFTVSTVKGTSEYSAEPK